MLSAALLLLALCLLPATSFGATIFSSDFESENPDCWVSGTDCVGWEEIYGNIALVTDEVSHSGNTAIKATFARLEDGNAAILHVDADHLFVRWYEYRDTDYDFGGEKTMRFWSTAGGLTQFDIPLGVAGQSNGGSDYCGINDMRNFNLFGQGGPTNWGSLNIPYSLMRNRWYGIEVEIRLNTPGASDGEVRMWVDGVMIGERTGLDMRGNLTNNINRVRVGGWYSNSWAGRNPCPDPVVPAVRYIDDLVVSDTYVGPIGGPIVPPPPPPNPPDTPDTLTVN